MAKNSSPEATLNGLYSKTTPFIGMYRDIKRHIKDAVHAAKY